MQTQLRIGVVGAGAMGKKHIEIWSEIPSARICAIFDTNLQRSTDVAEEVSAQPFDSLDAMCSSGLIDAVDICTPSGLHGEQAMIAIRHGLHVLVEKPLDISLAKVDEVISLSKEFGVTVGCIFQRRTYPEAIKIANMVHSGEFGQVFSCSAYVKWNRDQSYYDSAAWRGTWALDGGVLANQAIHAIDHLCWLCGRVTDVEYANLSTRNHQMEAEDFAVVVLKYENGAHGVIEATTCCEPDLCSRIELVASNGAVSFEDASVVKVGLRDRSIEPMGQTMETVGGGSSAMSISLSGHKMQMTDFADSILNRKKPMVDASEARKSVEALNLIYAKAYPGQKVGK